MTKVDQFESIFRSAERELFTYQPPEIGRVLVITDLDDGEAGLLADQVRGYLRVLDPDPPAWHVVTGPEFDTVADLLAIVEDVRPDLLVTYRHLHSAAWRLPFTLGDHLEVLTQATTTPVLLLPHPKAERAAPHAVQDTNVVMAITDHLTGDGTLVSHACRFTERDGRLLLTHLEDAAAFERMIAMISRIPELDTDLARREIGHRLLKEPADYIEGCRAGLAGTGVSLRKLGRGNLLLGFLLIEGLLTNIGGLLTLISSVPNIIVGTTAGISFVDFFVKAGPFVAVATVATILLGTKLFRIHGLTSVDERVEAQRLVAGFDENDGIESRGYLWFGAAMLVLFILTIATTSVLPYVSDLGMGFVALAFAAIMLVRHKHEVDKFYQGVDWDLLGFFAALFAVINVMEHAGVLALIGHGLTHLVGLGDTAGAGALLLASAAASSLTDNIPLAAMLARILAGLPGIGDDPASPFWWAVIFGANLGGNITPIGSASTLVAVTIVHKYELRLSFLGFVKKATPFALMQLALALVYVVVVMRLVW